MLIRFLKALFPDDGPQRLVLLLTAMLGLALYWASWAEIPQKARGTGQVIAVARTQVVQSANDGVVQRIMVLEGDAVKKGQLLMQLDAMQLEATTEDSRIKIAASHTALARLRAEAFQRPLAFDAADSSGSAAFVRNQADLYYRRKKSLDDEVATLTDLLGHAQQELAMNLPLLKSGDIAQSEVIRLQKSITEIQGSITNRKNKYFQDAQTEMAKTEEDLAAQGQMLLDRKSNLERMKIYAPDDGLVRNVRVTTIGGRVRPGDVLLDLLPTNSELIVETKLKPQDLAFIGIGFPVSIKLDAYDYSVYGTLEGEVIYISPDALTEDTRAGEHIYYRVHVRILDNKLQTPRGKSIKIMPGMTTQVEIETGKMTVLNYLTKPLVKGLNAAFTER
jgi:multidrug resistance efflux pump